MLELHPCPRCKRHTIAGQICPFCATDTLPREPSRSPGRLSRAAAFVAGAALASCGGNKPKTNETKQNELEEDRSYQNHPCVEPNPERVKAAEQKLADAKTDEEKQQAQQELDRANQVVCAPYGAPPARRRVV